MNKEITRNDQLKHQDNMVNSEGFLILKNCVACNKINHVLAAGFGKCSFCLWHDPDRNHCDRCFAPNEKPDQQRSVLIKDIDTHYYLCDPCAEGFAPLYRGIKEDPDSYVSVIEEYMMPKREIN